MSQKVTKVSVKIAVRNVVVILGKCNLNRGFTCINNGTCYAACINLGFRGEFTMQMQLTSSYPLMHTTIFNVFVNVFTPRNPYLVVV
jgi:coenzyme F420-reducing hydrogenase gamma subunit